MKNVQNYSFHHAAMLVEAKQINRDNVKNVGHKTSWYTRNKKGNNENKTNKLETNSNNIRDLYSVVNMMIINLQLNLFQARMVISMHTHDIFNSCVMYMGLIP